MFDAETSGMFDIEYAFNFCDTIHKKCNGKDASVVEFLDIYDTETDTCEILGQSSQPAYHLIDDKDSNKGLMVAYMGGAICSGSDTPSLNGLPRKTMFTLECSDQQDSNVSYRMWSWLLLVHFEWDWKYSRYNKVWTSLQTKDPSRLPMVPSKHG